MPPQKLDFGEHSEPSRRPNERSECDQRESLDCKTQFYNRLNKRGRTGEETKQIDTARKKGRFAGYKKPAADTAHAAKAKKMSAQRDSRGRADRINGDQSRAARDKGVTNKRWYRECAAFVKAPRRHFTELLPDGKSELQSLMEDPAIS